MKKAKRFLALFLVLCMMVCAMALPASAYSYNFSFPAQQANSMRSTSLYTRGTSTAYVDPDVTTISTIYFLSPTRVSSTQATALVYKTSGTRSNFSWLSGYGGKGNSYCLSGCPERNCLETSPARSKFQGFSFEHSFLFFGCSCKKFSKNG